MDDYRKREDRPDDDGEIPLETYYADPEREEEPEEEPVEWDGSEAELVADDDAAEYEETQTGIRLSYILRREEILDCLKTADFCKTSGKRAKLETVILVILTLVFLGTYAYRTFVQHQDDVNSLIFAGVCVLVMAVVWIVPAIGLRAQAKRLANGKEVDLEIYPDIIEIGKGDGYWEIPLDGTSLCTQRNNLIILTTPDGKMLILPLRSVEPNVLPEVQAMIVAGTRPE